MSTTEKLSTDDNDANRRDVYERSGGTTTLVSQPSGVADPDSDDVFFSGTNTAGTRVFFDTNQKLTSNDGDTNVQDVYQRSGGTTTLISQPTGVPDTPAGSSNFRGASADGSRVFFETAQKMTLGDDDGGIQDVYERAGSTTTFISQPSAVTDPAASMQFADTSRDGLRVFFITIGKLTADDTDSTRQDIYQRAGGATTLLSKPTGVADPDTATVGFGAASMDGTRVFFETAQEMTLDDTDANLVDAYEAHAGTTTLLSKPTGLADPNAFDVTMPFREISLDGTRVILQTQQRMTPADGDSNFQDTFIAAANPTAPPATIPAGAQPGPTGPTDAQIRAALAGDLRAAARMLKRTRGRTMRKRRRATVKGVDALKAGTVGITAKAGRTTVLRGSRKFGRAGKASLRLRLTKKGRRLLLKRRLRLTLSGSFTDAGGRRTTAKRRRVTVER